MTKNKIILIAALALLVGGSALILLPAQGKGRLGGHAPKPSPERDHKPNPDPKRGADCTPEPDNASIVHCVASHTWRLTPHVYAQGTYDWYSDVKSWVLNGGDKAYVATPILIDGVPTTVPEVNLDINTFTTGPLADFGFAGWYCDDTFTYCVNTVTDLRALQSSVPAAYDAIVSQLPGFPGDLDLFSNYDAHFTRLNEAKLEALTIKKANFAFDATNLQAAIDRAEAKDTVVLDAGTFYFGGATLAEYDGNGKLLNDIKVKHATGTNDLTFLSGGTFWYTNVPVTADGKVLGWDQNINIDKPLTITGTTGPGDADDVLPDGRTHPKPLTVIKALGIQQSHLIDVLPYSGYGGTFAINAENVDLKNLRFDNFIGWLQAWSPGFVVENNRVVNVGGQDTLYPDPNLTYPDYPKTTHAVKSYFRDNVIQDSLLLEKVSGSEISISNNVFNIVNAGLMLISRDVSSLGSGIKFITDTNNVIEGNRFECGSPLSPLGLLNGYQQGALYFPGDTKNLRISDNEFNNCTNVMGLTDGNLPGSDMGIRDTLIDHNTFHHVTGLGILMDSYGGDPTGIQNTTIIGNTFKDMVHTVEGINYVGESDVAVAVAALAGVVNSKILNNDYTLSGLLGQVILDAAPPYVNIAVLIFDFPGNWFSGSNKNNLVEEKRFPENTDLCSQVFDMTMLFSPPGLNNIVGWNKQCINVKPPKGHRPPKADAEIKVGKDQYVKQLERVVGPRGDKQHTNSLSAEEREALKAKVRARP